MGETRFNSSKVKDSIKSGVHKLIDKIEQVRLTKISQTTHLRCIFKSIKVFYRRILSIIFYVAISIMVRLLKI